MMARRDRPEEPERVRFMVEGPPIGKARARVTGRGVYTPAKTAAWERQARQAALLAMDGRPLITGPVSVEVVAVMPVPASWPKGRRAAALAREVMPTGKPDIDNIVKAALDSMLPDGWWRRRLAELRRQARHLPEPPCVIKDDSQIVTLHACKRYGGHPRVEVCVVNLGAVDAEPRIQAAQLRREEAA